MRKGYVALAALTAVVLLGGTLAATAAEPPGEAQKQPPAESRPSTKAGPEAGQRPADDSAQKREDTAPKVRLISILGHEVTNREGDSGRVIDVLVDLDGRSGAVVVEFGGFMGIGSRKVAVDWSVLRLVREGDKTQVIVDISREQIRQAAEYKPGEQHSVLGRN